MLNNRDLNIDKYNRDQTFCRAALSLISLKIAQIIILYAHFTCPVTSMDDKGNLETNTKTNAAKIYY